MGWGSSLGMHRLLGKVYCSSWETPASYVQQVLRQFLSPSIPEHIASTQQKVAFFEYCFQIISFGIENLFCTLNSILLMSTMSIVFLMLLTITVYSEISVLSKLIISSGFSDLLMLARLLDFLGALVLTVFISLSNL
jgi:hypothetical protein